MAQPSWPTPGDQREDHAQAAGEAVGAVYEAGELTIIAAIASLARKVASGSMLPKVAARQLRQTVDRVLGNAAPQARTVLTQAMTGAQSQARGQLAKTLPLPGHSPTLPLPASVPADRLAVQRTREPAALIDSATGNAAKSADDALTKVTKAITAVTEDGSPPPDDPYKTALRNAMDKFGGWPGQSLSYRRLQAAQVMLDELADKGITGFVDKAGRNWDLATYVEMATRTAVANAWDDMQADAAIRSGLDLVKIATWSTEGTCPHCLPWLGRTLSLTGATKGYPTIDQAKATGWRHPNCRCFWVVVGGGYAVDVTNPVPISDAARAYEASQRQRAHERKVRSAGRRLQASVTPQAKSSARRHLAIAKAASAAHRQQYNVVMMKVTVKRREAPNGPR